MKLNIIPLKIFWEFFDVLGKRASAVFSGGEACRLEIREGTGMSGFQAVG